MTIVGIIDPYEPQLTQGLAGIQSRGMGRQNSLAWYYDQMLNTVMLPSSYGLRGVEPKNPTAKKSETTLRICAPLSEMKTEGYELEDGYKLVYDPIVSIEITHKNGIKGEIILTAWGDEASDELVIDQNKN